MHIHPYYLPLSAASAIQKELVYLPVIMNTTNEITDSYKDS